MVTPSIRVERQNKATGKIDQAGFMVRQASLADVQDITRLYNSVMEMPYEEGLVIKAEKIRQRLEKDLSSVLVGVLQESGEPPRMVGIINNISLHLKSLQSIPPTHQELTANDSWENFDPKGNARLCPWVATDALFGRGWKGEFNDQQLSLAQILVKAVGIVAKQARQNLNGVIAYSRPEGLRRFIQNLYKDDQTTTRFSFPRPGTIHFEIMREGKLLRQELNTDRHGVFYYGPHNVTIRPPELMISQYANALDPKGKLFDHAYRLHKENGAKLDLSLVFVGGHPGDQNSLFYRTCFVYKWS
jgi:hypothetical protein